MCTPPIIMWCNSENWRWDNLVVSGVAINQEIRAVSSPAMVIRVVESPISSPQITESSRVPQFVRCNIPSYLHAPDNNNSCYYNLFPERRERVNSLLWGWEFLTIYACEIVNVMVAMKISKSKNRNTAAPGCSMSTCWINESLGCICGLLLHIPIDRNRRCFIIETLNLIGGVARKSCFSPLLWTAVEPPMNDVKPPMITKTKKSRLFFCEMINGIRIKDVSIH